MPLRRRINRDEENKANPKRFARAGRNASAVLISALPQILSGVSLHETVPKQAHLHLFLPDTIACTGDSDGDTRSLRCA
jgi:hypothetical protein